MDFNHVRAVLFDLDGTLYEQPRMRILMALELVRLPFQGPLRAPRRLQALRGYRRAQEALRGLETGLDSGAQIAAAAAETGLPVAEVEALVDEWMMKRPLKYLPFCRASGLDRLLAALDRTGRRAGVLSDYPAEAKLEALGLAGRFSPVLCATDPEIAAFKPNPRGYLRACEVWNLDPSDVLFVGDRAEVDAAGAAAAGMPCAIIGQSRHAADRHHHTFESLEALSRVLDNR